MHILFPLLNNPSHSPQMSQSYKKQEKNPVSLDNLQPVSTQQATLLFVEDNVDVLHYLDSQFNQQYNILKEENNFSTMDMMINYALTGETGEKDITQLANPNFKSVYCTLSILGKLGKIKKVIGVDELNNMKEVLNVSQWYYGGEEITDKYIGTQRQILCRVTLKTPTHELMAEAVEKVY